MFNIYDLNSITSSNEHFDELVKQDNLLIERIVSTGQTTPIGEWYEQDKNEWVSLIQGNAILEYEDGKKIHLQKGDSLLIPKLQKHRVAFTSNEPPCIWLAVHFD